MKKKLTVLALLLALALLVAGCGVKECVKTDFGKVCVSLDVDEATAADAIKKIDELMGK